MPGSNILGTWPLLMLTFGSWLVEVCGLYFLHTSCRQNHVNPAWAAAAGYPAANDCLKLYRFQWWTIVFELIVAGGLTLCLLRDAMLLRRYRLAWLSMIAINVVLHMLSTNYSLNLTDTIATKFETNTEILRAKVTTVGFAAGAALGLLLTFVLGDDGGEYGARDDLPATGEPLLGNRARGVPEV